VIDMRALVRQIASLATVDDAHAALRILLGAGATRWLADEHGISRRTARRWMSADPPASRVPLILGSVSTNMLAAQVLRRAQFIDPGTVEVRYDDKPQGSRTPPNIRVSGDVATLLHQAANALEADNLPLAEKCLSDAIMHGYQPGLEETLTISDYESGYPHFDF
jgi:hypothetical protein